MGGYGRRFLGGEKEVIVNYETVNSGCYMVDTRSLIVPGVLSLRQFDVLQIPILDEIR
jgi:hypothetical protein